MPTAERADPVVLVMRFTRGSGGGLRAAPDDLAQVQPCVGHAVGNPIERLHRATNGRGCHSDERSMMVQENCALGA